MTTNTTSKRFPHANEVLRPLNRFKIGNRYACLYWHTGRLEASPYTLYWEDRMHESIQHGMTVTEVFAALSELLEDEGRTTP